MSGEAKKTRPNGHSSGRIELVQVKVNGKLIPIKGFVQDFLGFGILGMLASLRGTENPEEVEIKIKTAQKDRK